MYFNCCILPSLVVGLDDDTRKTIRKVFWLPAYFTSSVWS